MNALTIVTGIIFSLFSTLVLSYISMATMVGPWIAPTLVLLGHILLRLSRNNQTDTQKTQNIALMQAIGAGGGIIATGIGFALPMLYFLEPETFQSWLSSPVYFCSVVTLLCLIAGSLGLVLGRLMVTPLKDTKKLPFPVSNLTYHVITSQAHPKQASMLLQSIGATTLICLLRDGIGRFSAVIAKTYYLFPSLLGKEIAFSIWPSLWAIGFTVGLSITVPLCIGLVSKYLVLFPLARHADYLPFSLFPSMSPESFAIAFCSGLVLCELVLSMPKYAKKLWRYLCSLPLRQSSGQASIRLLTQTLRANGIKNSIAKKVNSRFHTSTLHTLGWARIIELSLISVSTILLLTYFNFSVLSQALLLFFTIIATYSICQIGGEIGMVPFGRFSTFIVIPLLLIFKLNAVQLTIVCVFFNICAAAASDLLFDYKTGELCGIDQQKMYRAQWIGLIATSLCIGIFLWLLFSHLQLGSEALFAQRGKAKALLLQSLHFDKYIVFIGLLFGWLLKKFKINPTMVFGGLIMPNSITIGLLIGSLGTLVTKHQERYQPLCAGILAAESLWVLMTILAGML